MAAAGYRAELDAVVSFASGGGPRAEPSRVEVPGVTRARGLR